jgi:hypothetical protein
MPGQHDGFPGARHLVSQLHTFIHAYALCTDRARVPPTCLSDACHYIRTGSLLAKSHLAITLRRKRAAENQTKPHALVIAMEKPWSPAPKRAWTNRIVAC